VDQDCFQGAVDGGRLLKMAALDGEEHGQVELAGG
jgi:hypothetical protein